MVGNHGNFCFIIIFENVLEYVLFRSENFSFCLILNGPFSSWSINNRTIGRWKTGPKRDTLFLTRNFRGCKLSSQTNKVDVKRKSLFYHYCVLFYYFFFLKEATQLSFNNKYFHPAYLWCSLDHKLVQTVSDILFFARMQ